MEKVLAKGETMVGATKPVCITEYDADTLKTLLPYPDANAHKYSRGKLTLVAGCAAYPGAACLAAAAAQRAGAGYVEVICSPKSVPVVQSFRPSLVARSWDCLSAEGSSSKAHAICLGPGFDASDEMCVAVTLATVNSWTSLDAALLIDGGALGVIATPDGRRALRTRTAQGGRTVLTPHGGEAAKLAQPLGLSTPKNPDDEEGQARLARELAIYYASTVVLKGATTFISDGEKIVRMQHGTAALAKAGTGDVLAGTIAALLAQGMDALDACVLGSTWHAKAGVCAEKVLTSICVTPEDVIKFMPQAVLSL